MINVIINNKNGIFKKDNVAYYIGKNDAQSFQQRIANHLDIRGEAWMNSLLKTILKTEFGGVEKTDRAYIKAFEFAIEHFEVLLINFSRDEFQQDNRIALLEDLLINILSPNNSKKKKINYNVNDKLSYFIQQNKVMKTIKWIE